jgi:Zn-dependent protease with chaperone function
MKNSLSMVFLIGLLGFAPLAQCMLAQYALSTLSKTTTALKWTIAGGMPWKQAYEAATGIIQDPDVTASPLKPEKITEEEENFLREGDTKIKVYVYDSPVVTHAGGFSFYNALLINRWVIGTSTNLLDALKNKNDFDLQVFGAIRDHEKRHIHNGDHIINPFVCAATPFATGYALHATKKRLFPVKQNSLSTLRSIGRSMGRIPVGAALCAANMGILIGCSRWQEYRADEGIKVENIDGAIRWLSKNDEAITRYAPEYFRQTGVPLWLLSIDHPPVHKRIARLQQRKQAWEAAQKVPNHA